MANPRANNPPPPMPWMARNSTSWNMDWASPHSAEPTMKLAMAIWKTMRRP